MKDYVAAARKVGLKVGFYYSGPDWYFDKEYMNFLYYRVCRLNPEFPELGPDLKPRTQTQTKQELTEHQKRYAELVNGQVEELLTRYGKIDLLWFDGAPKISNERKVITQERIRELQPGIVINPRMHGKGDFITFERHLPDNPEMKEGQWGEFCNPWNGAWPYVPQDYKDLNLVLADLLHSRAFGLNYLLGIGPMADGDLAPEAYENMHKLGNWMQKCGEGIYGTSPLSKTEKASVPSTAKGNCRYLYIIPREDPIGDDAKITFAGATEELGAVTLLSDKRRLTYTYNNGVVSIVLPSDVTSQVDVVKILFEER